MWSMRTGLLVVALAGAACYEAPRSGTCSITCTPGVSNNCPEDLACEGGYCVGRGQVCRPSFVRVAAGTGFACGIDDQAALWCWGTIAGSDLATRIDTSRRWSQLDAGGGHVCGIADGALLCWGENDDREVSGAIAGDVASPTPITVADVATWTAVSAGADYTCAIGDGTLFCWGKDNGGQLGDGMTSDLAVPTPVASKLGDWTAVAAGGAHTCAVSAAAGIHCFGRNTRGELGPALAPGTHSASPVAVTAAGMPLHATALAVGNASSCAVTVADEVYCWGNNANGQLGDRRLVDWATIGQSSEPVRASDVPGWTAVAAGELYYCGLAGDAVHCWGGAPAGGIGVGFWNDNRTFATTITRGARDVSVGWNRNLLLGDTLDLSCAVVGSDIQCWGDNRFGQLGRGNATMVATPAEIVGGHRWLELSAGAQHVCGIADDATLYCWGSTLNGQTAGFVYGDGQPCAPNASDPAQPLCDVGTPRPLGYAPDPIDVVTGTAHTCALSNGVVSCWGSGLNGNAIKRDIAQPGGQIWQALLPTGRNGQCGVAHAPMGTGPTYCFGTVLTTSSTPVRVNALDGFTAIGLGGPPSYGVFLDATGVLHGQGDNSRFQLGDGTQNPYNTLTSLGRTYSAIATRANDSNRGDANFVCGIRAADAKVECWGTSSRGQTAAGDVTPPTTTPNEIGELADCTAIATGIEHACAVCGGSIYCWGDNRAAQLATAPSDEITVIPRRVDIALDGDAWVDLVAGLRFTCARSAAGRAMCWGMSERGALGNGGTGANLPMPVRASRID
jgi:alpha-tubulin suppressor-like RCC1 family protein